MAVQVVVCHMPVNESPVIRRRKTRQLAQRVAALDPHPPITTIFHSSHDETANLAELIRWHLEPKPALAKLRGVKKALQNLTRSKEDVRVVVAGNNRILQEIFKDRLGQMPEPGEFKEVAW